MPVHTPNFLISIIFDCVDYTSKQVDLASLFERLQQAEQRATELTTELNFVLKHLDNVTQTTNTSSSHAQGEEGLDSSAVWLIIQYVWTPKSLGSGKV